MSSNDMSSEITASQIARSIIEFALSLKSQDNEYRYLLLYQGMTVVTTKPIK